MNEAIATGVDAVRWDLTHLYSGPEDPNIAGDEATVDRLVEDFQSYRGSLSQPTVGAAHVEKVLKEYEKIQFQADRLVVFAALAAAANQEDEKLAALNARMRERQSRWSARLVFAELELRRLPVDVLAKLSDNPALKRYRHYLRYQMSLAPHTLSEAEEQIILKKNIGGRDAQVRFREEYAARLNFGSLFIDGVEKPMTFASLIALQEGEDPELRFKARQRINETFHAQIRIFGFLYGNVVKDHGVEQEIRSYAEPIDVENVPNEIPSQVVRNLLDAARRNLPVLHGYYQYKAGKLGVPRLRTCDLMAPYPGIAPVAIPWSDSRDLVQQAFARLDPSFGEEVGRFFEEGRLDAAPRRGKRGGAFCAPVPGHKPHILMSYVDTMSSLVTLAHELGHGVHFVLSGSAQTYLQAYSMSKVIAETASEFGECLLRDQIIETSSDANLRKQLLVKEAERFIGSVHRQLLFTEFEIAVHEKAAREPLTAEGLCELWEKMARLHYGPHVEPIENDRVGWAAVGHFVFNPFYCYSYALSQVVVLALYRKWKREGRKFLPHYLDLLRGGWSGTPQDLLAQAGIDLLDPGVLDEAFREFEDRIRAAQEAIG